MKIIIRNKGKKRVIHTRDVSDEELSQYIREFKQQASMRP